MTTSALSEPMVSRSRAGKRSSTRPQARVDRLGLGRVSPTVSERSGQRSIAVLGSVALDTIETPAERRDRILGGSATYFAAAARLTTGVGVISVIGDDFQPEHEAALQSLGVDTTMLERKPGNSYAWHGRYGADYANAMTVRRDIGVIDGYSPPADAARGHQALFLGAMDPSIQLSLLESSTEAELTALDSRESWIDEAGEGLLKLATLVDFVFLNSFELSALTGQASVERGAETLLGAGAGCVIVKRGVDGAALYSDGHRLTVQACETVVVDPTGAGDAFAGGFMGVLIGGNRSDPTALGDGLRYGAAMASVALESFGIESLSRLSQYDLKRRADSVEWEIEL
jgi:sugar/nucleoside kinase (ribokinase family)